jgi:hypothetical protein
VVAVVDGTGPAEGRGTWLRFAQFTPLARRCWAARRSRVARLPRDLLTIITVAAVAIFGWLFGAPLATAAPAAPPPNSEALVGAMLGVAVVGIPIPDDSDPSDPSDPAPPDTPPAPQQPPADPADPATPAPPRTTFPPPRSPLGGAANPHVSSGTAGARPAASQTGTPAAVPAPPTPPAADPAAPAPLPRPNEPRLLPESSGSVPAGPDSTGQDRGGTGATSESVSTAPFAGAVPLVNQQSDVGTWAAGLPATSPG